MLVKEAMSKKVEAVTPTTTAQECARRMTQLDVGALPVWDGGKVIGVVTDRDICCRAIGSGRDAAGLSARDVMSGNIVSCFDDQHCTEAARLMEEKHVRRLMVINRNHAMVGLFSVDDLARYSHELAGVVLEAASPWPH
jgi:predicted transcriptional regulator